MSRQLDRSYSQVPDEQAALSEALEEAEEFKEVLNQSMVLLTRLSFLSERFDRRLAAIKKRQRMRVVGDGAGDAS